jgi:hypothetical protein
MLLLKFFVLCFDTRDEVRVAASPVYLLLKLTVELFGVFLVLSV